MPWEHRRAWGASFGGFRLRPRFVFLRPDQSFFAFPRIVTLWWIKDNVLSFCYCFLLLDFLDLFIKFSFITSHAWVVQPAKLSGFRNAWKIESFQIKCLTNYNTIIPDLNTLEDNFNFKNLFKIIFFIFFGPLVLLWSFFF